MSEAGNAKKWFYLRGADEYGPVTLEELKSFLQSGELPPGVSVRGESESDYVRASDVAELKDKEEPRCIADASAPKDPMLSPAERRRRDRLKKYAAQPEDRTDPFDLSKLPLTQYGVICIVAVNAFMFLYLFLTNGPQALVNPDRQGLLDLGADFGPKTILEHQYWRVLTAMFIHAGAAHFFLNMFVLWQFGRLTEHLFGRIRFVSVYLLCGWAGALLSLWWNPAVTTVGASGAVFGVLGLLVAFCQSEPKGFKREVLQNRSIGLVFFLGYNVVYGFFEPGIDNAGHLGGLVTGYLAGFVLKPKGKSGDRLTFREIAIGSIVVLSFACSFYPLHERVARNPDVVALKKCRVYNAYLDNIRPAMLKQEKMVTSVFERLKLLDAAQKSDRVKMEKTAERKRKEILSELPEVRELARERHLGFEGLQFGDKEIRNLHRALLKRSESAVRMVEHLEPYLKDPSPETGKAFEKSIEELNTAEESFGKKYKSFFRRYGLKTE